MFHGSRDMRVIAGDLRGRPIRAPEGPDTRPTSDRAREAVFNILLHAAWAPEMEGARLLDLFAGSGALGLEALSRGAASCLFVERAEPALTAVRANIAAFKLEDRARVLKRDATALGERPAAEPPFDIAFLDPPYGKGLGEQALAALLSGGWLAEGAVVVFERGSDEAPLSIAGFEVMDERRYGAAAMLILACRGR